MVHLLVDLWRTTLMILILVSFFSQHIWFTQSVDNWFLNKETTQTRVWSSLRIRFTHAVHLVTLLLLVLLIALEVELYSSNEDSFLTVLSYGKS